MKYLEKFLKGFLKDQKAVTPVVGVILMVAVTVVMGAVIAGFVYGYVGVTEKGPLTGLSVTDDPTTTGGSFLIKHTGGETIDAGDWKLSVTLGEDAPTTFVFASAASGDGDWPETVMGDVSADISAGKTLKVFYQTDNNTAIATESLPQWYHVVITHAPSNSLLLDTNVQVR